jgi:hypothetical protein
MELEEEMLAALLLYLGGSEFGSVEWEIKMRLILGESEECSRKQK